MEVLLKDKIVTLKQFSIFSISEKVVEIMHLSSIKVLNLTNVNFVCYWLSHLCMIYTDIHSHAEQNGKVV